MLSLRAIQPSSPRAVLMPTAGGIGLLPPYKSKVVGEGAMRPAARRVPASLRPLLLAAAAAAGEEHNCVCHRCGSTVPGPWTDGECGQGWDRA
eukprot:gene9594-15082_t